VRGRVRYPRATVGGISASLRGRDSASLPRPLWAIRYSRDPRGLVSAGSEAELHMIPDRDHAGMIGRSARDGDPARELILSFIALHTNFALARVQGVQINDGNAQRSMVNSLTVTFNRTVTVDPGTFELRGQDGSPVGLNVVTSVVNGQTMAVLTFAGADIIGGSLADWSYTLTVLADHVHDRWGRQLDGDGNGSAGGDRVDAVFRLFGDSDGDHDVDWVDRDLFQSAFQASTGDAAYVWFFDFDGDGNVDGHDNGQFN